ncbi:hypothetical protein BHE74_00027784 [Ensete ventricosum]|nr:hypothetical protein GW17_00052808 [Ensete ventricosum]RWW64983.1 hypothetical protein BHE74_00027784 [Ensete ventricosum]
MKKMGPNEEGRFGGESPTDAIEVESTGGRISFSGPLSGPLNKRGEKSGARVSFPGSPSSVASVKGKEEEEDDDDDATYVEITLDVRDDTVAVHSVKAAGAGGDAAGDPEVAALARELERRSAFGASVMRTASWRFRQVSQELRRLTSFGRRPGAGKFDRTRSAAAQALKGLKFISKADGAAGWAAVDRRFDELAVDGTLDRSKFAQCIDIGSELRFQAPNLLRYVTIQTQSSIITLSASANNLSKIQDQAEEYAALIMEELDPDSLGYIEVKDSDGAPEKWSGGRLGYVGLMVWGTD